jgi:hypothetical protein
MKRPVFISRIWYLVTHKNPSGSLLESLHFFISARYQRKLWVSFTFDEVFNGHETQITFQTTFYPCIVPLA